MIFVSNQLTANPMPELEQQLAAYNNLTQSLSEEFDRAHELQAQALQTTCESWSEFFVDLSQLKNPQEFFLRFSAQTHVVAGQSQLYLQELVNLGQQIQQKIFALGQTISPMMVETIVAVSPAENKAPLPQADSKIMKDINLVKKAVVTSKTKNKINAATVEIKATDLTPKTKTVRVDVKDNNNLAAIDIPTPKVRKVKPKTSETTSAVQAEVVTTPVKKSAVVGLPSKPAVKSGFAGAAGQPEFKAKSSKATGAKKRVRQ